MSLIGATNGAAASTNRCLFVQAPVPKKPETLPEKVIREYEQERKEYEEKAEQERQEWLKLTPEQQKALTEKRMKEAEAIKAEQQKQVKENEEQLRAQLKKQLDNNMPMDKDLKTATTKFVNGGSIQEYYKVRDEIYEKEQEQKYQEQLKKLTPEQQEVLAVTRKIAELQTTVDMKELELLTQGKEPMERAAIMRKYFSEKLHTAQELLQKRLEERKTEKELERLHKPSEQTTLNSESSTVGWAIAHRNPLI